MKRRSLINGRIYTVAEDGWCKSPEECMLIGKDGRIEYIGKKKDFGDDVDVVDLDGKTVLPGFVDAHVHIPGTTLTDLFEVNLFSAKTMEKMRECISSFAEEHPEQKVIFGTGFDMSMRDETGREPCADWVDDLDPDRMMIFQSNDMHSTLLNTKAMEYTGVLDDEFRYDGSGRVHRDESGRPTGLMTDTWDMKIPVHEFSKEEISTALKAFEKKMLAWGYTSIMAIAPFFKGLPVDILELTKDSGMCIRVNGSVLIKPEEAEGRMEQLIAAREKMDDGRLKITTAKYMIDGVIEGNTAFLCDDYSNRPGFRGRSVWGRDDLVRSFKRAAENGFQIHTHTIGDGAVKMTLDALEEAGAVKEHGRSRNVLTHLQVVDSEDIGRFGKDGLIAAVQTFWHYKEPGYYENIEIPALGRKRAEDMYPLRSLKENGAVLTASGDYPVSPDNDPLLGIQMGVTRNIPEGIADEDDPKHLLGAKERLTVSDMVEAYTVNGAYQLFREEETGSLEVGKYADYVVLSDDPFAVDHMDISGIRVMETCIEGKTVYKTHKA